MLIDHHVARQIAGARPSTRHPVDTENDHATILPQMEGLLAPAISDDFELDPRLALSLNET